MRFTTEYPPSEPGERYIKTVYNKITMQIQFVYYKYMIYNVDYKFKNEESKKIIHTYKNRILLRSSGFV